MMAETTKKKKKIGGTLIVSIITMIVFPLLKFTYNVLLNNTFEIAVEETIQEGLGTSYSIYEITTEPELQNAKLGLQGYIEVFYEEEKLATVLVNDLYGNCTYQIENGKISISCKNAEMREYCDMLRTAILEQCEMDGKQLEIRCDTIMGFSYAVLHQNYIIPRYFRLNGNQPLHISKNQALEVINQTDDETIFVEGTLDELRQEMFEDTVGKIKMIFG